MVSATAHPAGAYEEKKATGFDGPPVLAIRWDGWSNNSSLSWWTSAGISKTVPSGSKWHYRQPSLWSNFELWRTDNSIDTASIVDSEIAAAKGILDGFLYDFYPPLEILAGTGDEVDSSNILRPFQAHLASSHRTDVKFALIIGYNVWTYPNHSKTYVTAMTNYIVNAIADPGYFRMPDGKPLIVLYNDSAFGGWLGNPTDWMALKTAIGEPVFALAVNSPSMVSTLGLQGNMFYEYNGQNITTTGRHLYSALIASDIRADGTISPGGPNRISSRTVAIDERPINVSAPFTDSPTQPQWYAHMLTGMASTQKLCIVATWDEVSEQGIGLAPSMQEGTRYLDAIKWIKDPLSKPALYTFKWSANWFSCGTSGTWTEYFPDPSGVQGAHDGDQIHSTETGAYRDITIDHCDSCDVYAETGPDCGIVEILKDGVVVQTVDCYAASQSVSVKIATVTYGDNATHTTRARVTGTKNGSSSDVKIKLDYFAPTYKP